MTNRQRHGGAAVSAPVDLARLSDEDARLLAYGLLWMAPTDRSTWVGLLAAEARAALLMTITREQQQHAIALAKSYAQTLRLSEPREWSIP